MNSYRLDSWDYYHKDTMATSEELSRPITSTPGTVDAGINLPVGQSDGVQSYPVLGLPSIHVSADELFNPVANQGYPAPAIEWNPPIPVETELPVLPPGVVPMVPIITWQDFMASGEPLPADWNQYPTASAHPMLNQGATLMPTQNIQPGDTDMAQDWGDFLGGLAQDYITGIAAPGGGSGSGGAGGFIGPQQLPAGTVGQAIGAGGAAAYNAWRAGLTLPTQKPVRRGRVWNPRTGEWTSPRRRRRRLLTETDFADLAKLQSLTGKGQAFTVAVMKAVKR